MTVVNQYREELKFHPLTVDELVSRLKTRAPFTYLRLCHGFWELLAKVETELGVPFEEAAREDAERVCGTVAASGSHQFLDGFMQEFCEALAHMDPSDEDLLFAVSLQGWKRGGRIEGTPRHPAACIKLMRRMLPEGLPLYDGLLFKDAVYDSGIIAFFEALKQRHLVIVGPERAAKFAGFLEAEHCKFIGIHPTDARRYRRETEDEIATELEKLDGKNPVVLLQAGNLAVLWPLALRARFPEVTFIDLGQIMDMGAPELVFNKPWGKAYIPEVREFYRKYRPALFDGLPDIRPYQVLPLSHPERAVPFVENKSVDQLEVDKLLAISRDENHWTNFGPVNRMLEERIASDLKLPEESKVIATSNCTAALEAVSQTVERSLGRKPRWLVPAFSFFSTSQGAFADGRIVDSAEDGYISLERLREIPAEEYDGIVMVNLFGLQYRLKPLLAFAKQMDKFLIIDNAAGYAASPNRVIEGKVFETISFHHTKAQGFGEGGCILAPKEHEATTRSIANFGIGLDGGGMGLGMNAKLSEVAAAYILQRLNQSEQWRFFYSTQARRIEFIGQNAGLKRMVPTAQVYNCAPGQVPFLAGRDVSREDLANANLTLLKYYPPCAGEDVAPVANALFRRVINVPCHPQVAEVPEDVIFDLLSQFA